MARKELINTFLKLDTDTSQNKQDNTSFYDGQNLRLVSDEALTNGALVNYKGTKAKIDLGSSFLKLKGYAEVGSDLALLLHKDADSLVPEDTTVLANTVLKNYSTASGTSYSNITNFVNVTASVDSTIVGPVKADLLIGEILRYNNGMGTPFLNLYQECWYKVNIDLVNNPGYTSGKACVMVVNSNSISGSNAKAVIHSSDVIYHKNYSTLPLAGDEIEFYVPKNLTSDYYVVFFPGNMLLIGSNYEYDLNINSIGIEVTDFKYKDWVITDVTNYEWTTPMNWSTDVSPAFSPLHISNFILPVLDPLSLTTSIKAKITFDYIENALGLQFGGYDISTLSDVTPISIITDNEDTINGPNVDVKNGAFYNIPSEALAGTLSAIFTFNTADITANTVIAAIANEDVVDAVITDYKAEYLGEFDLEYQEIDADYKSRFSPEMLALVLTGYDAYFYNTFTTLGEYTPLVSGGIVKGYKYRLFIKTTSSLGKQVRVGIGYDPVYDVIKDVTIPTNTVTTIEIDLTDSTYLGAFRIYVWAELNDTVRVEYNTINKIYKEVLLHTISGNTPQFYEYNLSKAISGEATANIIIKNGSTVIKKIAVPVQQSGEILLKRFINYVDYDGYTINIDMSPSLQREAGVNVSNVKINTISTNDYEVATLLNNKYYIFKTTLNDYDGYPSIEYIKYKVIKTSNSDVITSKLLRVGIEDDLRVFIPDDGNIYKLYAELYKDDSTLITTSSIDTSIVKYALGGENYIGSIIARVSITEDLTIQPVTIVYSDQFSLNKLNFDKVDEVQCVGKYENDSSKKIYFTVPGEPIRTFNIARDTVSTVDVEALDIIPNNILDSIVVDSIINGGNLENGKIQYACKLFNKYGTETTFSPPTELISLTDSTATGEDEFKGGELEQSSGKSVKLIINVENVSDFNYVKIYSIHYKTVGTPVISLVGEQQLINTSITFIDSGIILEQITLEEYNAFGGRLVSAEVLAERNNILFAANIQESLEVINPEDLDCRAYRFKDEGGLGNYQSIIYERDNDTHPSYYIIENNGDATFYQYNGSTYVQVGDSIIDYNIPITADAINKYNNEFEKPSGDVNHPYQYDLTADGLYIGGTGKIVSYVIETTDEIEVASNLHVKIDATNINTVLKSKSLKQGEVYRFGLVPYDNKGKPFFVNWIGDIRIPYFNGSDNIFSGVWDNEDTDNIVTTLKNIQIVFTINTAAISTTVLNKISGFQLVQVERTDIDKSVVAQGYTYSGALYSTSLNGYGLAAYPRERTIADNNTSDRKNNYQYIHYLISPEFNLNKGKALSAGNYRLRVNKILIVKNKVDSVGNVVSINSALAAPKSAIIPVLTSNASLVNFDIESITVGSTTVNRGISFDVEDFKKLNISKETASGVVLNANGNPVTIFNRVISDTYNRSIGFDNECTMFGQSCIVFTSSQSLPVRNFNEIAGIADAWFYQLDLYQDNINIRYGGDTYEARLLNTYIAASDFIKKDVNTFTTWGDVYNTIFDTLIAAGDPKSSNYTDNANQIIGLFPIESSANCFLTGSKPSKYYDKYPTTSNFTYLQETQLQGIELFADKYPSIGDLNRYNTVYSANPKYPIYVVRPALFEENIVEKYSIINSQKKTVGEFIDSWAKFLYANTLEVSGKYGPIHGLTDYNNKLIFLQEDAIGVASVNERYLIGQDASQLTIGTGGVLERYDYMKYNTGVIKPTHFINTETDIFYIDSRRKVIDSLADNPLPLSILKGINSLFRGLYKDSTTFIAMGFDPLYKEVLITINNGLSNKTLVFNSMIGEFTPMQSTTPELYLSLNNELMSFLYSNQEEITRKNYVYRHNAGKFGETYSEAGYSEEVPNIYPSYISFIVNTKSPKVSIFDNIEFNTEVREPSDDYTVGPFDDTEYVKETIDSIQFRNSYQNETRTVYPKDGNSTTPVPNASRLIRRWSMAIPLTATSRRFVDTFLSIKMQYNNRDGKLFKLHDVITYIREANN